MQFIPFYVLYSMTIFCRIYKLIESIPNKEFKKKIALIVHCITLKQRVVNTEWKMSLETNKYVTLMNGKQTWQSLLHITKLNSEWREEKRQNQQQVESVNCNRLTYCDISHRLLWWGLSFKIYICSSSWCFCLEKSSSNLLWNVNVMIIQWAFFLLLSALILTFFSTNRHCHPWLFTLVWIFFLLNSFHD